MLLNFSSLCTCAQLPAAAFFWLPLLLLQMESTLAMQAVAPRVKELQAKYANDPETLQLETARMYKTAGINPLAGCLPTLATIPVFIGLYRCACCCGGCCIGILPAVVRLGR